MFCFVEARRGGGAGGDWTGKFGAGLGWGGLGFGLLRWIMGRAARNETHTISIYPGLEGLGFRV